VLHGKLAGREVPRVHRDARLGSHQDSELIRLRPADRAVPPQQTARLCAVPASTGGRRGEPPPLPRRGSGAQGWTRRRPPLRGRGGMIAAAWARTIFDCRPTEFSARGRSGRNGRRRAMGRLRPERRGGVRRWDWRSSSSTTTPRRRCERPGESDLREAARAASGNEGSLPAAAVVEVGIAVAALVLGAASTAGFLRQNGAAERATLRLHGARSTPRHRPDYRCPPEQSPASGWRTRGPTTSTGQ